MTNTPFFAPSPRGLGLYEKEKLALMKRKKKDFDYMTSSVLMEHQKHLLASLHFKVGFIVWYIMYVKICMTIKYYLQILTSYTSS